MKRTALLTAACVVTACTSTTQEFVLVDGDGALVLLAPGDGDGEEAQLLRPERGGVISVDLDADREWFVWAIPAGTLIDERGQPLSPDVIAELSPVTAGCGRCSVQGEHEHQVLMPGDACQPPLGVAPGRFGLITVRPPPDVRLVRGEVSCAEPIVLPTNPSIDSCPLLPIEGAVQGQRLGVSAAGEMLAVNPGFDIFIQEDGTVTERAFDAPIRRPTRSKSNQRSISMHPTASTSRVRCAAWAASSLACFPKPVCRTVETKFSTDVPAPGKTSRPWYVDQTAARPRSFSKATLLSAARAPTCGSARQCRGRSAWMRRTAERF